MMRVEMADATASLSEYAKKARKEPVVVMQRGKPVAALLPVTEDDWEDFVVGTHPGFLALIERSRARFRAGHGIPLEEIRRKYGLPVKAARKPRPKAG